MLAACKIFHYFHYLLPSEKFYSLIIPPASVIHAVIVCGSPVYVGLLTVEWGCLQLFCLPLEFFSSYWISSYSSSLD